MKKYCLLFIILSSLGASGQSTWNAQFQQYIDQYKDCAIEQML